MNLPSFRHQRQSLCLILDHVGCRLTSLAFHCACSFRALRYCSGCPLPRSRLHYVLISPLFSLVLSYPSCVLPRGLRTSAGFLCSSSSGLSLSCMCCTTAPFLLFIFFFVTQSQRTLAAFAVLSCLIFLQFL